MAVHPQSLQFTPLARALLPLILASSVLLATHAARGYEDYSLERILTADVFRPEDLERIRAGEIVRRNWSEYTPRDISIALAFLCTRDPAEIVRLSVDEFEDIRLDPRVRQLRILPDVAELEHFDGVVLGEAEAAHYLAARPGDQLNLSREEIRRFQEIKRAGGGRKEAERELRRQLFERHRAYAAKGLAGMAPYAREDGRDLDLGARLAQDIRKDPAHALTPHFRELILQPPSAQRDEMISQFVLIEYEMNDRQAFVLRHRVGQKLGRTWAMMERDYYVSHHYNASQGFWAVVPADGGTLVFYGVRSNTDNVTGFGAAMRHALGRRIMASQLASLIERQRAIKPTEAQ